MSHQAEDARDRREEAAQCGWSDDNDCDQNFVRCTNVVKPGAFNCGHTGVPVCEDHVCRCWQVPIPLLDKACSSCGGTGGGRPGEPERCEACNGSGTVVPWGAIADTEPPASPYDENYFERGPIAGVSHYMNYSWMPERTLRMAHKLIQHLPIKPGERVLDFGCAKGYLVKALRILDVKAYGCDVSAYALQHADAEVRPFLFRADNDLGEVWSTPWDLVIAKCVLEHLTEPELEAFLFGLRAKRLFVVLPLGLRPNNCFLTEADESERFVIPVMHADVTHKLAKPVAWWVDQFTRAGWHLDTSAHDFPGIKEDWIAKYPAGHGFFTLSRR